MPRERAHAVSLGAGPNGLAIALGPTLDGILVDAFGRRSIFLVTVPVGMLGLHLVRHGVPESADPHGRV
jgi:DHA2 family methylenomycin A resistance protein-like MFS transporter